MVTKLRTSDTSSTSLLVGCAVGSTTCTGGIKAGILDTGLITSGGAIGIATGIPAVTTMKLYNNAGTLTWNGTVLATGASLSGTLNTIPVFTGASSVGDSIMTQSGTTITVANTLSATTLTGTLSTVTQPNVTTMAGLTSIGTIATGTWNATIIGISKGGTGVSLTGTGGTSQFLRQNSAGATITVVRPALADLSDASNVAILNAANTFSHAATVMEIFNTTAANGGYLSIQRSGVGKLFLGVALPVLGAGTNNDGLVYTDSVLWLSADGGINFADVGVKRWGINAAGDFTFGASSNISDSVGTPAITSGFDAGSAIVGTDYAFKVTKGTTGGATQGIVTFGHTWTTAPICTVTASWQTDPFFPIVAQPTTTTVTIGYTPTTAQEYLYVLCRSY